MTELLAEFMLVPVLRHPGAAVGVPETILNDLDVRFLTVPPGLAGESGA